MSDEPKTIFTSFRRIVASLIARLRPRFLKQSIYGEVEPASRKGDDNIAERYKETAAAREKVENSADYAEWTRYEPDRMLAAYTEAIRRNPQDASEYWNRGKLLKARGDVSGAIADFQRYLDLGGGKRDGDQAQVEDWIKDLQKHLK